MNAASLDLSPLIAPAFIAALAILALAVCGFAAVRGLKGWIWRGLAALLIAAALANPALVRELREPLSDIALLILDDSISMEVGERTAQADAVRAALEDAAARDETLELVTVSGGRDADGTRLADPLREGLGRVPRERLAGVVVVSDGQTHDGALEAENFGLDVPVHHLLAGDPAAGDRRLVVSEAPRYGLVGEFVTFTVRVEDDTEAAGSAEVSLSVDGGPPVRERLAIGRDVQVRARLDNRGPNTVQIEVEPGRQELSLVNNRAAVSVTGVRDRLRVLLVTGEPHNGARAWRNLLKSDPGVDLVHFTILRPLDKDDSVPADELALIAFPVFELFQLRLNEFDLVIFDRYRRRGILRPLYFDNIARYVEGGGALLVTTGPPFAGPESVARSPLASVLPATPDGTIEEGAFTPEISAAGQRHPVTAPMSGQEESWGPWYRRIGARAVAGETLLESPDGDPLLTLARAGEGRAAILLSDQAWLWARGHEGGGPHDELFRRVAHWLMGEPELDEERLSAQVSDGALEAVRTTLAETAPPLVVEWPSGAVETLDMSETAPGRFTARTEADELGLVRLRSGDLTAVVASGPLNPREYADLRPDPEGLAGLVDPTGGGVFRLASGGPPQIRRVNENADAGGRGWLGLERRGAYRVTDAERTPLAPGLLIAALILGLLAGAWRREGG
ncbi:MAG: hypothetical protein ABL308_08905 [Oceanicaulis sp.]